MKIPIYRDGLRIFLLCVIFFCFPFIWKKVGCEAMAQSSNQRTKLFVLQNDSTQLDTFSIIPGTISVKKSNGEILDSSSYVIDYVNAFFILKKKNDRYYKYHL
ncbi:MAG: hypothetical protein V1781_05590 [Bacteroidota bacterium]